MRNNSLTTAKTVLKCLLEAQTLHHVDTYLMRSQMSMGSSVPQYRALIETEVHIHGDFCCAELVKSAHQLPLMIRNLTGDIISILQRSISDSSFSPNPPRPYQGPSMQARWFNVSITTVFSDVGRISSPSSQNLADLRLVKIQLLRRQTWNRGRKCGPRVDRCMADLPNFAAMELFRRTTSMPTAMKLT